jgi:hypothetical protein
MTRHVAAAGTHPAEDLLEVERLTPLLTADWLAQQAMMPLRTA